MRSASAAIGAADKKELHDIAKQNIQSVTVVGHASRRVDGVTDPVRRKMINFQMAQKRADAVVRELKKAGANPSWVQAVSQGDDTPNPDPGAMSQEDADRRAEVYVDGK